MTILCGCIGHYSSISIPYKDAYNRSSGAGHVDKYNNLHTWGFKINLMVTFLIRLIPSIMRRNYFCSCSTGITLHEKTYLLFVTNTRSNTRIGEHINCFFFPTCIMNKVRIIYSYIILHRDFCCTDYFGHTFYINVSRDDYIIINLCGYLYNNAYIMYSLHVVEK